ncbi:MAG: TonB-dependent receptor plug domain-containing protein, partial [Ferruginibacter sp.]
MKKIILFVGIIMPLITMSQKKITGKVFDVTNGRRLAQASIVTKNANTGTTSDNDGKFVINITENVKAITASYAGYQSVTITIVESATDYSIGLQSVQNEQGIVVIGSRNLSRTKVQTPVPVDVIPVAEMAKQVGQIDLSQLLTYAAPSFQSSRQTVADGTDHVDPAQLRGLGSDQVLVLVNGKRRHQSALVNVNGTVNRGQVGTDLNSIPVSAIERVEILRDGAAAQYGSDAIAGVINIVLKKSINLLSGNVSYGQNITSYQKNYALGKLGNAAVKDVNVQDGGSF